MTTMLRDTATAWRTGRRNPRDIAALFGISPGAARQRLRRARLAGLLAEETTPAPRGSTPGLTVRPRRTNVVPVGRLAHGGWLWIDEPVVVTHRGEIIAEWHPVGGVRQAATDHLGGDSYAPEPAPVELAKLAYEVAKALAEVEELRDELHPGERLVTSKRAQELNRRRRGYLKAVKGDRT
jgi:hypothetical protein